VAHLGLTELIVVESMHERKNENEWMMVVAFTWWF
jgi:hypothetical protein